MILFILYVLIVIGQPQILQPKIYPLKTQQTCEDFFNEYKQELSKLSVLQNKSQKLILSQENLMPGFVVVCSKLKPTTASVYIISKKGKLHTEQDFFLNFLYEKINQVDEITPKNDRVDEFGEYDLIKKRPSLEKVIGYKRKNSESPLLNKNVLHEMGEILPNEETIYQKIMYNIYIYVEKSPCAQCMEMYYNIQKIFKNVNVKVYYSFPFNYNNINVVQDPLIKNLDVTKECLSTLQREDRNNYIFFPQNTFFTNPKGKSRLMKCINKKTQEKIKNGPKMKNLSFHLVKVNPKYRLRYKILKDRLGL